MSKIGKYGKWMHNIQSLEEQRVKDALIDKYLAIGWVMGRSERVCDQVSASLIGLSQSKETRQKRSRSLKGRIVTPEHRAKIGKANSGRKASKETRKKQSDAHKRRDPESYKRAGETLHRRMVAQDGPSQEVRCKLRKNNPNKGKFGSAHPSWRGGVTPIHDMIRRSTEYGLWRTAVFERDKYTCQDCGKVGGYLEAHHNIKKFSVLLSEFLQQYSQFSPIEDKETLIRLATTYELFWDTHNGRTLCKKCHHVYTGIEMTKLNKETDNDFYILGH